MGVQDAFWWSSQGCNKVYSRSKVFQLTCMDLQELALAPQLHHHSHFWLVNWATNVFSDRFTSDVVEDD